MNAEELKRDRVNHPDKYKKRNIQITFEPSGPDRWQEYHDGYPVGVVTEIPRNARPVDPETPEARRQRLDDEAFQRFEKCTADSKFETIRERMRAKASSDPELEKELNESPTSFVKAYNSLRRSEIEEAHQARLEAIRQRQASSNAMERAAADSAIMQEIESHRGVVGKIQAGVYEGIDPVDIDDGDE